MTISGDRLMELLPAIIRIRDEEEGGPLAALLNVIGREVDVLREDLAQGYDDLFVETCAEWVLPYIGDLLGMRPLIPIPGAAASQRAYVANTLAYRRRKGTASVLEQLARDITNWDARAVEFFQLLATTQHVNHPRDRRRIARANGRTGRIIHDVRDGTPLELNLGTPDLRDWEPLERANSAFDTMPHTVDVRRIATGRGRFNIPNIGIFLWRLAPFAVTDSPAVGVDGLVNSRRLTFSPLGINSRLFTLPETEDEITHLAAPLNVPEPISRQVLDAYLGDYYGWGKSLVLRIDDADVPQAQVRVCDLSDIKNNAGNVTGWAHVPKNNGDPIAIDPLLGRIAIPPNLASKTLLASYHYGFSAEMGGGEYERSFEPVDSRVTFKRVARQPQPLPLITVDGQTIQTELVDVGPTGGIIEILDSDRYEEALALTVAEGQSVELRAANGRRPTIIPTGGTFDITGASGSVITLDGLLIAGAIRVRGEIGCLRLRHCTLVPGRTLNQDSTPVSTDPSLTIEADGTVRIDHCILGGIRAGRNQTVTILDSIVDATTRDRAAYDGLPLTATTFDFGGPLTIERSTVVGTVNASRIDLASNSIFLAKVKAERRQQGCVRFSYLPPGSETPRRFNCQPVDDADDSLVAPRFTSLRYGDPAYGQLAHGCPLVIARGADDEAEMGVFHDLYQPQRVANLRARFDEYLRFGLEAGILFAT
jgi:hypothetical protein